MPKITKSCKCGHRKTDHKLRTKTKGYKSYGRFMECEWKNCECKEYK